MTTCSFTDEIVLDGLLVSHLLDEVRYLLHCLLDLRHYPFLTVQGLLLLSSLPSDYHLNFCVEPSPQIFLILRPERHLVFELPSQVFIHLSEHA